MKISVVIPVYNSEQSLSQINDEINKYFDERSYEFEKIFVNDRSTDNSFEVLNKISLKDINLRVIDLKHNYGQQNAIFCGLHLATGDYIVTMDDDLQHNINDLDILIDEMKTGKDLVYGIYALNTQTHRNLGSRLTRNFFRRNFKYLKNQSVSSFRIFSKELLESTLMCPYKFIYLSGIMLSKTWKIGNVSVIQRKRVYGKSGYSVKKLMLLFLKLNWYYSKHSIEWLKAKGSAFEIKEICNKGHEVENEENYDVRRRRLSVKCN